MPVQQKIILYLSSGAQCGSTATYSQVDLPNMCQMKRLDTKQYRVLLFGRPVLIGRIRRLVAAFEFSETAVVERGEQATISSTTRIF